MNDHDETRLRDGLHEHVDRLAGGGVSFDDVRRRAGRLRRNRRITVTVAGAAAAAVVVPTALLLGGPGSAPGPVAPTTTGPVAPATTAPTTDADPFDLTLPADPGAGEPPRTAWAQGRTVHLADGTQRQVERAYDALVVVGPRIYGSWSKNGGDRFLDVDDGQGMPETVATTDTAVVSRDGTMVAWGEPDGSVRVAGADATTDLGRQPGPVAPVAVTGDPRCELDEATSCAVYTSAIYEQAASVVTSSGQSGALSGLLKVNDVDGTLVAGQTSYEDGRACSELRDGTSGEVPWKTCDHALGRFSPDGRHLLASPSDIDGLGSRTASVLSAATGKSVATWSVDEGFVAAQYWEDDEHVLVLRYTLPTASWDVLRLGLDGTVERALEPVEGIAEDAPVTIAGNR